MQSLIIIIYIYQMTQKKHKTKIGHSLQQLQDGLILTLQDKPVLLNGQVNEDDDVFENYERRVQNQAQHNRQLKQKLKIIANAATSHLQAKNQGAKGILPHYDDYKYKTDQVDLDDGNVVKRSRPKQPKNVANDYQTKNNINSQYYERNVNFKKRKNQKQNSNQLLSFLNQTALEKDNNNQELHSSAADIIEQSLNTVKKRRRVENQTVKNAEDMLKNQDEQLLAKAIKLGRQKNHQNTVLNIIKQQIQEQPNNNNENYTEIQMNPVNYKQENPVQARKIYNIRDAAKGTTSCLNVHLPSEKIVIKKQQQMPQSFGQISKEKLEKMKQEVSFLEEKQFSTGLAGTLQFLRQNNLLGRQQQFGRTNDKESHHNQPGDRIKLQYRNASGKLMKPKQAFRYMSAIFHGQGPGKNKIQKIKKKQLLEMKMKQNASGPGKLMNLLENHQQKSGEAHMVIQLGAKNKEE